MRVVIIENPIGDLPTNGLSRRRWQAGRSLRLGATVDWS